MQVYTTPLRFYSRSKLPTHGFHTQISGVRLTVFFWVVDRTHPSISRCNCCRGDGRSENPLATWKRGLRACRRCYVPSRQCWRSVSLILIRAAIITVWQNTISDDSLPDGAKDADHLRHVFGRMGYSDQEIVALSGAHNLGQLIS